MTWWQNDPVAMDTAKATAWWQNDPVSGSDAAVAKEREGGGVLRTVGEGLRTALNGVALGYADELGAAMQGAAHYVTGGRAGKPYDEALEYERAYDKAVEADQGMAAPALKVAGALAAAPVMPVAQVFSRGFAAPGLARVAGDAALNAGAYSAAQGFGEGEGGLDNRLDKAAQYGAVGAPLGGAIGAGVSRYVNARQGTAVNSATAAGDRLQVRLPQFMEGSTLSSNVAGKLGAIPFVGDDINTAVNVARGDAGGAATRINWEAGGGEGPQAAGQAVRDAATQWGDDGVRAIQERIYRPVTQAMAGVRGNLTNTAQAVQGLLNRQQAANNPAIGAAALREVEAAATNPQGLTFEGMQALRSRVGSLISDKLNPESRVDRAALQRVYAALSTDIETMMSAQAPQVTAAWRRANGINQQIEQRRTAVARVIGARGDATGESIVDRIVRMAGSASSGDAATLLQARRAAGPQAWRQLSGEAILRLGRNRSDEFSPDFFLQRYTALSPAGRRLLFASTGSRRLEGQVADLATISQAIQRFNRLGNASGTGGVVALVGALGAAASGDMGATLAAALGGRLVGRAMSQPATVRQAAPNAAQLQQILSDPALPQAIAAAVREVVSVLD